MLVKLDHVGIVVKDIDEALIRYTKMLGLTPWDRGVVEDSQNGVRLVLLPIGDNFIELIQPISSENRFAKFLKERGEGLFHLSIFVEGYNTEISTLREKGYTVIEEEGKAFPEQTIRLAWLPPESTGGPWVELVDITTIPQS